MNQSRYAIMQHLSAEDFVIHKAEAWVREHIAQPFDISALAQALNLSPRTLARRAQAANGMSPIQFVQRVRVEVALNLSRTSSLVFADVAGRVGYSDAPALTRLIAKESGMTLAEIRRSQNIHRE